MMAGRLYVVLAALFGFTGVAAGAFAAHALEAAGDPRAVELMRVGSSYALWHALAMIGYLALWGRSRTPLVLFSFGIFLFSFSLYALAFGAPSSIAYATPIGGILLLGGWVGVALVAIRDGFSGLNDV
jgi:uncharacterized membrane protein YgdD (TMEM256/DUF423 family)